MSVVCLRYLGKSGTRGLRSKSGKKGFITHTDLRPKPGTGDNASIRQLAVQHKLNWGYVQPCGILARRLPA